MGYQLNPLYCASPLYRALGVGIGIYAPGGKMESILFGVRGYYD